MQSFSNLYQMYKWLMYKDSSFPTIVIQFEDNRIIRAGYSRYMYYTIYIDTISRAGYCTVLAG